MFWGESISVWRGWTMPDRGWKGDGRAVAQSRGRLVGRSRSRAVVWSIGLRFTRENFLGKTRSRETRRLGD